MSNLIPGLAGNLGKLALGASAWMLLAISSASAQYYPPGTYGGPPPGHYRPGPPPGHYRSGPPPRYEDDSFRPRRARMGSVCVTSRGSCQQRHYSPLGASCTCIIPGFGRKRGGIER